MRDDTLLRMRAVDAGFDRALSSGGDWLAFAAAGNLATLWLSGEKGHYQVAASPAVLEVEIGGIYGLSPITSDLPDGAAVGWHCLGDQSLDALCRRIAVLGQVLPDQPLRDFERKVEQELKDGPRTTERIVEVRQRVGQNMYRYSLMKYWHGRCALTGVSESILLRASHAKPWKDCTDAERLDVHNGLLLAIHLDTAFDAGLITIGEKGDVVPATKLKQVERRVLGLESVSFSMPLRAAHEPYLAWHRQHVFQG